MVRSQLLNVYGDIYESAGTGLGKMWTEIAKAQIRCEILHEVRGPPLDISIQTSAPYRRASLLLHSVSHGWFSSILTTKRPGNFFHCSAVHASCPNFSSTYSAMLLARQATPSTFITL